MIAGYPYGTSSREHKPATFCAPESTSKRHLCSWEHKSPMFIGVQPERAHISGAGGSTNTLEHKYRGDTCARRGPGRGARAQDQGSGRRAGSRARGIEKLPVGGDFFVRRDAALEVLNGPHEGVLPTQMAAPHSHVTLRLACRPCRVVCTRAGHTPHAQAGLSGALTWSKSNSTPPSSPLDPPPPSPRPDPPRSRKIPPT